MRPFANASFSPITRRAAMNGLKIAAKDMIFMAFFALLVTALSLASQRMPGGAPALPPLFIGLAGAAMTAIGFLWLSKSGGGANPLVVFAAMLRGQTPLLLGAGIMAAQTLGAAGGVMLAHNAFSMDMIQNGFGGQNDVITITKALIFAAEIAASFVITFLLTGPGARKPLIMAGLAGLLIVTSFAFTPLHSFINPALTFARTLTTSDLGLRPDYAAAFLLAEFAGALAAVILVNSLSRLSRGHASTYVASKQRQSDTGT